MAINIGPAINDMRVCELCNSDHIQHPNDLKRRERWTYKGTHRYGEFHWNKLMTAMVVNYLVVSV